MTLSPETLGQNTETVRALFDPRSVALLLRERVPLDWSRLGGPRDVRIARYWPVGEAGLALEWSFSVTSVGRHSLYAVSRGHEVRPGRSEDTGRSDRPTPSVAPRIDRHGLQGIYVDAGLGNFTIHSPDQDAKMPHLAQCLDAATMTGRFVSGRTLGLGSCKPPLAVVPRLLSYRAGRRAAIGYRTAGLPEASRTCVGKTFRDARGERLVNLHARLHDALQQATDGRVTVPTTIGYDAELRMAMFSWASGRKLDDAFAPTGQALDAAADALQALHRVELDDLPRFGVTEECVIVQRWNALLRRLDARLGVVTQPLVARLLGSADTLGPVRARTLHRDFYEKQMVTSAEAVTLLDLDTLAYGSPCVDLGNYLAHLLLSLLIKQGGVTHFGALATRFLGRYEHDAGGVDRRALAFYLASALYRLGAVHALRTETGHFAETLWQLAAIQLEGQLLTLTPKPRSSAVRGIA